MYILAELTYTGGLNVYSMSFLDESYMDDWSEISYLNRDIVTGSVTVQKQWFRKFLCKTYHQ